MTRLSEAIAGKLLCTLFVSNAAAGKSKKSSPVPILDVHYILIVRSSEFHRERLRASQLRQNRKTQRTEYQSRVMAKEAKNQKPGIPFMKAYNFLLNKPSLTSAEKLVMVVVCRFWPNPYWDSNGEVARSLALSERYIEKVVKSLADKGVIKRGYAHITKNGRPHTVRVIVPRCFPKTPGHKVKWVKTEHMDGQQTEHIDGDCPNNSSFLPEQLDDLLDKNRQINRKTAPTPLPAGGQAPALLEDRKKDAQAEVEQFKNSFGSSKRRKSKPSAAEIEQIKQKMIGDLRLAQQSK